MVTLREYMLSELRQIRQALRTLRERDLGSEDMVELDCRLYGVIRSLRDYADCGTLDKVKM